MPPQAITEFQALWKKHYGVELPPEQIEFKAHQVFTLVRLLVEGTPPPDGYSTPGKDLNDKMKI